MAQTFGFEELGKKLEELKKLDLQKIVQAGGWYALAESQKIVHVDTGNLRASGNVEPVTNSSCAVTFQTSYAYYEEMKHPYLRPIFDTKRAGIVQNMKNEIKRQMEAKIR